MLRSLRENWGAPRDQRSQKVSDPGASLRIPELTAQYLQSIGHATSKPESTSLARSIDLVANIMGVSYAFEFKEPGYLTFDSIAQAKTAAVDYEKEYRIPVTPVVVGVFEVPAGTESIAKQNGVRVIGIPQNTLVNQVPNLIQQVILGE